MEPGWTEIVQRHEEITDPAEGRRLVDAWLEERGVSFEDLGAGDIEMRQWLVRGADGKGLPDVYTYLMRDDALPGVDSTE